VGFGGLDETSGRVHRSRCSPELGRWWNDERALKDHVGDLFAIDDAEGSDSGTCDRSPQSGIGSWDSGWGKFAGLYW
jgi:hypothetical protein